MTGIVWRVAAIVLSVVAAQSALANDSTAALGAGGIVLTESADIRMASEDLFVSREVIRVRYSFINESQAPITTRVAFPLPVADLDALGESDVGWPTDNQSNIVAFKLKIDGRAVKPELEEKAFLKGQDVSDVLRRFKVPFGYRPGMVGDALKKLPAAARKELTARGLMEESGDWVRPLWTVKSTFHWQQTFPPQKPVAVEHEYKPVVGGAFVPASTYFEDAKKFRRDEFFNGYCVDATTFSGIEQRLRWLKQHRGEGAVLFSWFVDYVLTTGKNWKGPIAKFRLTVDKGKRENLISFCMDGVRKTGATTFAVERRDFEPEQDLKLMIIETPPAN